MVLEIRPSVTYLAEERDFNLSGRQRSNQKFNAIIYIINRPEAFKTLIRFG